MGHEIFLFQGILTPQNVPAQGKVSAYGSDKGTEDVQCEQEGLVSSTPFGRVHAGSCLLF